MTTFAEPSVSASTDLVVEPPGQLNAVALTFRAGLYAGISHTLEPWTWPASSWATSVWVLPEPTEIGPGSILRVHYHRRVAGTADGLTYELVDTGGG